MLEMCPYVRLVMVSAGLLGGLHLLAGQLGGLLDPRDELLLVELLIWFNGAEAQPPGVAA